MANRVFLLDRSGSMESCWDDTIGGYNAFVKEQAQFGGTMTLVQFDHEYTAVHNQTEPLTRETYKPRGSTALYDAIGRTIKAWTSPDPPTVIILTDGIDNASKNYTKAHVKDLIDMKTKEGWQFVYLGANQDAFEEAGAMGIGAGCTMNFDSARTPEAFTRLSAAMSQQASNPTATLDLNI